MTYQDYARLSYEEKVRFDPARFREIVETDHAELQRELARTTSLRYILPRFVKAMWPGLVPVALLLLLSAALAVRDLMS